MDVQTNSLFQRHTDHVWQATQRAAQHNRASTGESESQNPFAKLLTQGVQQVNDAEVDSNKKIEQLLSGEDINQAEVFTSIQKADMSFRLLVQIRNKLLQAFEELNGIRV
ncbi:MAG: flagellar hook-basal body complex protein FliE [Planctomycetes bacterium]|nr:flagellar hook-basal body complex protein FliE [Planctomycetota bacterium]